MTEDRNFGDIVGDVLAARKEAKLAENQAQEAARKAARGEFETKFRALFVALQQTKAKFPRTGIYCETFGAYGDPHFFTDSNTSVRLSYDTPSGTCRLSQAAPEVRQLAASESVEDLLPTLIDLLATAVAHGQRR